MTQQHPNPRDLIGRMADQLDHYRHLLMDDRRETHALATEARAYLSQPEPEGPTAWMYLGEPNFDGRDWHDHWEVTLDEKLARYASGNNDPVPLWRTPAISPAPKDS